MKSEVLYAVRHEMAVKPNDILCRRVPLAVLDAKAAAEVVKDVVDIMGKEKKWSTQKKKEEIDEAIKNLAYLK
jgi:glycerol-3-phosphate dehydrogenase